jgi:copper chaperone
MKTLKFKSNIKCTGCLAKVSPILNAEPMLTKWEVDILTPEKTLTIQTNEEDTEKVIKAIEKGIATVGFKIEEL